jgi:hypothetical protein
VPSLGPTSGTSNRSKYSTQYVLHAAIRGRGPTGVEGPRLNEPLGHSMATQYLSTGWVARTFVCDKRILVPRNVRPVTADIASSIHPCIRNPTAMTVTPISERKQGRNATMPQCHQQGGKMPCLARANALTAFFPVTPKRSSNSVQCCVKVRLAQCAAVEWFPQDDGRKSCCTSFISATTVLNALLTCLATSFRFHSPLVFQITPISAEFTCSNCSTLNPDVRSAISA